MRDVELENGIINLRAEATKSRRADVQVLHPELNAALIEWKRLALPHQRQVISIVPSSRCVAADLKFAGINPIQKQNAEELFVDFHALRKTLCTLMAVEGVNARIRQARMRHADPILPETVYLDERLLPVRQAIENLPFLGSDCGLGSAGGQHPNQQIDGSPLSTPVYPWQYICCQWLAADARRITGTRRFVATWL